MRRKRRSGAVIGFSNEKFISLLSDHLGHVGQGELSRETPLDLSDLTSARSTLLLREIYSKYDDGKPSENKERTTMEKFMEAETRCRETNHSIRTWHWTNKTFWVNVRSRIRDVLGSFSWDECEPFFGFGPGATTRLRRAEAAAAYKYSGIPESTIGNSKLASLAIARIAPWKQRVLSGEVSGDVVNIVSGNRVITVPKTYKSDRTIAIEPCMNSYIQKGIGRVIRNRLKRVGVNLDDQVPNQIGARIGSLDGSLATIDLSMASDTVSRELVGWLLPLPWWSALEQCRSPRGVLLKTGLEIDYEKFSSMGNGYTFELETLLFWAITQSVCRPFMVETERSVRVYGDDIIVPTEFAEELISRLEEVGFKPNPSKSFWSGPYRESCGKHYFNGADITPFYVRKPVRDLSRLFLIHNQLYRWMERTSATDPLLLDKLKNLAPSAWREPRLPDGFGDGAFIGAIDELRLDSHPYGWECWVSSVLCLLRQQVRDELPDGQLSASLKTHDRWIDPDVDCYDSIRIDDRSAGITSDLSTVPVKGGRYCTIPIAIPKRLVG